MSLRTILKINFLILALVVIFLSKNRLDTKGLPSGLTHLLGIDSNMEQKAGR